MTNNDEVLPACSLQDNDPENAAHSDAGLGSVVTLGRVSGVFSLTVWAQRRTMQRAMNGVHCMQTEALL